MPDAELVRRKTYELSLEDPSLFRQILEDCWEEVAKRVKENPEDIENVQLFRLFSEMNRVALQLGKTARPAERAKVVNLFTITAGLPVERQVDLYKQAIQEIESNGGDASAHRVALEQLLGEKGAANALALEGEVDGEV